MSAANLDGLVWEWATNMVLRPSWIISQAAGIKADARIANELDDIDRAIAKVERQQANLARALGLFDDDEAAAPTVAAMNALARERKQLQADRDARAAEYRALHESQEAVRGILDQMAELRAGIVGQGAAATVREVAVALRQHMREMPYQDKRALLRRWGVTVELFDRSRTPRYEIRMRGAVTDSVSRAS